MIVLKPGREKSVLRGHPWIFSGAIARGPKFSDGDILPIHDHGGNFLALGYFHNEMSIAGRILSFEKKEITSVLKEKLLSAFNMRKELIPDSNCFRHINAEGDGLSGLIIDYYDGVFVIQISTVGMERLKSLIVTLLVELFQPKAIYEKSLSSSLRQEGLEMSEGTLYGNVPEEIEVVENGIKFLVSITKGQKTGLFLDQRSMRKKIGGYAIGKRVLNCFSYTGGFSLFALKGGASEVVSVDSCKTACSYAQRNTELNALSNHIIHVSDVFDFLKSDPLNFNLVILDPPAFAKKRNDVDQACKGYIELNRLAIEKMPPRSLLLTCSCSCFIDQNLFQNLISQASCNRNVRILEKHTQAVDHPVNIHHPEGEYLKSLFLYIE